MNILPIILISLVAIVLIILFIAWIMRLLKGSIAIQLPKNYFSPGETIKGALILKLRKPLSIASLSVGLEKEQVQQRMNNSRTSTMSSRYAIQIKGSGAYPLGVTSIPFTYTVPENILATSNAFANQLLTSLSTFTGRSIRWYFFASADIPGLDLRKRIRVSIS